MHSIATGLVLNAFDHEEMILCAREFQTSIADSVHPLLVQKIIDHGLKDFFKNHVRRIEVPLHWIAQQSEFCAFVRRRDKDMARGGPAHKYRFVAAPHPYRLSARTYPNPPARQGW